MEENLVKRYLKSYNDKKNEIIKNLFLHENPSPYDDNSNNSFLEQVTNSIKSDKISKIISSNEYIKSIQLMEEEKMLNMYVQLKAFLISQSNISITNDIILKIAKEFSGSFREKVKKLNKVYREFIGSNKVGQGLVGNDGRIRWDAIQSSLFTEKDSRGPYISKKNKNKKESKERVLSKQEDEWFKAWFRIFSPDNGTAINLRNIDFSDFDEEAIERVKQEFLQFEEKLQNEIQKATSETSNDPIKGYAKAEMIKIIQRYTLGRGVALINELMKKVKKDKTIQFKDTKDELALSNSFFAKIKDKINKPEHIHYGYKSIKGSFTTTIGAGNFRGFVAEAVRETLENSLSFNIKGTGQVTWKAENVGGKASELGKMQKIDNEVTIPKLVIINQDKQKGQEISLNPNTKDMLKISYSLKDYRDESVSLHSGGNLDSIEAYLRQNMQGINNLALSKEVYNFLSKLKTDSIKYVLLNEGEPSRIMKSKKSENGFYNVLNNSLSDLGPVFALSKITEANDSAGVDFLVINNIMIPGSYLFLAVKDMLKTRSYNTTISPPDYPGIIKKNGKKDYTPPSTDSQFKDGIYSSDLLKKMEPRNRSIYNKITFHISLRNEFKKFLIKQVSNI